MLQVNQSNTSVNNFVNFLSVESSIDTHMDLTLYKTTSDNRTLKKTILIFTGYEYDVSFYDFESGTRKTITGIIESINGDNTDANSQYITMKYWPTSNSCTCNTANNITSTTRNIPGYGCILNNKESNTDKYQSPETINIYIANITDMNYTSNCCNNIPEQPKKKGEKVVLLGISANVVKAIIVNLKLIDDSFEDAIKDITMETGKIYNIAYISKKDKAIYEFTGKLIAIKETNQAPSNNSIVITCKAYGLNNSIYEYDACGCDSDKDTYMSSESMKNDVLLTFDTSTDFSGNFEYIMLSWIRDCAFIGDGTNPYDIFMNDNCCEGNNNGENINSGCKCSSGIIKMKSGNCTTVIIDPAKNNVHYSHNGNIGDITLQELVDFYFCSC